MSTKSIFFNIVFKHILIKTNPLHWNKFIRNWFKKKFDGYNWKKRLWNKNIPFWNILSMKYYICISAELYLNIVVNFTLFVMSYWYPIFQDSTQHYWKMQIGWNKSSRRYKKKDCTKDKDTLSSLNSNYVWKNIFESTVALNSK